MVLLFHVDALGDMSGAEELPVGAGVVWVVLLLRRRVLGCVAGAEGFVVPGVVGGAEEWFVGAGAVWVVLRLRVAVLWDVRGAEELLVCVDVVWVVLLLCSGARVALEPLLVSVDEVL